MRVFVTGATGFIGKAVVRELLDAGHQVLGLARSDQSAAALTAAGAEVHRGALDDLDSLREGAAAADGVIHLAFVHDFSDYAGGIATDLQAVKAIGAELEGTDKPFVITSGTAALSFALPSGQVGTEQDTVTDNEPRGAAENVALALAGRGVRSSIVRLSACVHNEALAGFATFLIGLAREKGVSAYVGDVSIHWPAVHRLDAARLFRLALESAPAGSILHGVGEEGVPLRDIAEVIGRRLNVPAVSISREEADAHFGFLGPFITTDNRSSNALTRERVGWEPTHLGLIADLEQGQHFSQ
ncbi:SDR family oxidoreductase [Paenibacillus tuaregi]|uniref:SDR family oxidoreductase n=1 Tax=Paenibacillus tuaregi TaxID=1816681 RepID=UPI00083993C9|nr:SDR family oxidoreductase [Paenibacillus tuaregi]